MSANLNNSQKKNYKHKSIIIEGKRRKRLILIHILARQLVFNLNIRVFQH